MDDSQEMTTPLNRFFTFWWILAGFAVFGLLALIAYVFGGKDEDVAYKESMAARLATKGEVVAAQATQLSEVKFDIAAGVAALSSQAVAASDKAVPGSPTHDKLMAEMAAKMEAEAAANSDASAVKLTLTATNSAKGEPPLQYVEKELTVSAGAAVELTFVNPDVQMHNVVLCKIGKSDGIAALAMAMAADPQAMAKGYIPESDDILASSKLLTVGQQEVVKFTAPSWALKDVSEIQHYRRFNTNMQGCNFWWLEFGGRLDTVF
jgi:plastocyanin